MVVAPVPIILPLPFGGPVPINVAMVTLLPINTPGAIFVFIEIVIVLVTPVIHVVAVVMVMVSITVTVTVVAILSQQAGRSKNPGDHRQYEKSSCHVVLSPDLAVRLAKESQVSI
jgi:hypothetical protein